MCIRRCGKPWLPLSRSFETLSIRRIALGTGGAVLACLLLCYLVGLVAVLFGNTSMENGVYQSMYFAILLIPLTLLGLLVLLPLVNWLARLNYASLTGVLFIAMLVGLIPALIAYYFPKNAWCTHNVLACVSQDWLSSLSVRMRRVNTVLCKLPIMVLECQRLTNPAKGWQVCGNAPQRLMPPSTSLTIYRTRERKCASLYGKVGAISSDSLATGAADGGAASEIVGAILILLLTVD